MLKADRNKFRTEIEMVLNGGIERTGLVINDYEIERNKNIYYDLLQSGMIDGISQITDGNMYEVITNMQKEHGNIHEYMGEFYGDQLSVQPEYLGIFNLELEDGTVWDLKKCEDMWNKNTKHISRHYDDGVVLEYDVKTWRGIYLGYDYMDVPVGTKLIEEQKDYNIVYEVLGHLKNDSQMIKDEFVYKGDAEIGDSQICNLNTYVIEIIDPDEMLSKMFIKTKERYSIDDVNNFLREKYSAHIESLDGLLKKAEARGSNNDNSYIKLFFLIAVLTVSLILCFEILENEKEKKQYGIMLANGAKVKDLFDIKLIEMILKYIMTVSIASSVIRLYFLKEYSFYKECYNYLIYLWQKKVFWYSIIVIGIVLVLGNFIPLLKLFRINTVELIKGISNNKSDCNKTRDMLSSTLLVITMAVCVIAVYNCSDIITKNKIINDSNEKYKNNFRGNIAYNIAWEDDGMEQETGIIRGDEHIKKEQVWNIIKRLEIMDVARKKIRIWKSLDDEYSSSWLIFDFSNEYLDDVDYFYEKRKEIPGVYISKGLQDNVYTINGKKYIAFDGVKYLIKGVYKDYSLDHSDYRIVIPWNILNKKEKSYYINVFKEYIMSIFGIGIEIGDNKDINEEVAFINKIMKSNNLHLEADYYMKDEDGFRTFSCAGLLLTVFSLIDAITVVGMWIIRRRDELMIKKTWGMSDWMLYRQILGELSKHLIISIPLMAIIQALYIFIFKEEILINFFMYFTLILGVLIILLFISYAALERTRKLKPAEGLREE